MESPKIYIKKIKIKKESESLFIKRDKFVIGPACDSDEEWKVKLYVIDQSCNNKETLISCDELQKIINWCQKNNL